MPDNDQRTNLKIDFKKWGIRLDDKDEIFPAISEIEKIDGDPNNVISNIGGGKWLVYEFSKRPMPKKVELIMDGVVLGQKAFPKKTIVFYQDTPWHYVPLIFIHTEWPYSHDLPCD